MKKNVQRTLSRVFTAITGAICLMAIILIIESIFGGEKTCLGTEAWILCQIRESTLLSLVEGFSILVAVFLFFLETPERDKQAHYEAWKTIDSAHGLRTSYARFQALQDLNEDSVSLSGLNAPEADLKGINLSGADLSNAFLSGVDLSFANLSHANLSHANLVETNLSNANLSNAHLTTADLSFANLIEANLYNVDFVGANLVGTNFVRANLSSAYFGDVNFSQSILKDAKLKQTKFFGVKNLTKEQIKEARNWKEAIYDTALLNKLNL
ncbi:MAG: pentapeptide repeat-containing protein [Xenococcaceae cyanobacterium MO_188.B32]|nr:pentapeptide repeat-containing protein [Xenococcaceae cyanobacterium MO_188.B32]